MSRCGLPGRSTVIRLTNYPLAKYRIKGTWGRC